MAKSKEWLERCGGGPVDYPIRKASESTYPTQPELVEPKISEFLPDLGAIVILLLVCSLLPGEHGSSLYQMGGIQEPGLWVLSCDNHKLWNG